MFFVSHLPFSRPACDGVPRTNKNKDKEKKRTRARNKLLAHRRWSGVMSLMARTMLVNADIWSFAMQVGLGPLPPLNSKKSGTHAEAMGKMACLVWIFLSGFSVI
jgi:hypothetical protein